MSTTLKHYARAKRRKLAGQVSLLPDLQGVNEKKFAAPEVAKDKALTSFGGSETGIRNEESFRLQVDTEAGTWDDDPAKRSGEAMPATCGPHNVRANGRESIPSGPSLGRQAEPTGSPRPFAGRLLRFPVASPRGDRFDSCLRHSGPAKGARPSCVAPDTESPTKSYSLAALDAMTAANELVSLGGSRPMAAVRVSMAMAALEWLSRRLST